MITVTSFTSNTVISSADMNANFNALVGAIPFSANPIAAKGDLLVGSAASVATTVSIGTAGQVLKVVGGTAAWAGTNSSNLQVVSKTAGYSVAATDDVILCSGNFNLTIPDAASNSGKMYTIKKTDSSLTNIVTILPTGSDNIEGAVNYPLYTLNESVVLVALPAGNWQVLDHKCNTPWATYALTIGGTVSAPTKASSPSFDLAAWRRVGDSIQMKYTYAQTSASGAAAGSGSYLFPPPAGVTFSTSFNSSFSSANLDVVGSAFVYDSGLAVARITLSSASALIMISGVDGVGGTIGSSYASLSATTIRYGYSVVVPVAGWQP